MNGPRVLYWFVHAFLFALSLSIALANEQVPVLLGVTLLLFVSAGGLWWSIGNYYRHLDSPEKEHAAILLALFALFTVLAWPAVTLLG